MSTKTVHKKQIIPSLIFPKVYYSSFNRYSYCQAFSILRVANQRFRIVRVVLP